MIYVIDRTIQTYINEERARCVALVKLVGDDPDFLIWCIAKSVSPTDDIAHFRKRFAEFEVEDAKRPEPDNDFEDLM